MSKYFEPGRTYLNGHNQLIRIIAWAGDNIIGRLINDEEEVEGQSVRGELIYTKSGERVGGPDKDMTRDLIDEISDYDNPRTSGLRINAGYYEDRQGNIVKLTSVQIHRDEIDYLGGIVTTKESVDVPDHVGKRMKYFLDGRNAERPDLDLVQYHDFDEGQRRLVERFQKSEDQSAPELKHEEFGGEFSVVITDHNSEPHEIKCGSYREASDLFLQLLPVKAFHTVELKFTR